MQTKPLFATVTVQTDNANSINNATNTACTSRDLTNDIKHVKRIDNKKKTDIDLTNKEQNKTVGEQRDMMHVCKHEVTFRIPMTLSMTVRELAKAALHRFAHSHHYRRFFPKVEAELTATALSVKTVCVRSSDVQEAEIFAHDVVCDVVDVHRELIVIAIEKVAKENHVQTRKRGRSLTSEDIASKTRLEECNRGKSNDMISEAVTKKCEEESISTTLIADTFTAESSACISCGDNNVNNENIEIMSTTLQEKILNESDICANLTNSSVEELMLAKEKNDCESKESGETETEKKDSKVCRRLGCGSETHKKCDENYVPSPQKLLRRRHGERSKNTTNNVCEREGGQKDNTPYQHTKENESNLHKQEQELEEDVEQTSDKCKLVNTNTNSSNVNNAVDATNNNTIADGTVAQNSSTQANQHAFHNHLGKSNNDENIYDDVRGITMYNEHDASAFAEVKEWACTEQSNGSSTTEAGMCTLHTHDVENKTHLSTELHDDSITNNVDDTRIETHNMPAAHSVNIVETIFAPMSVMHKSEERVEHVELEHLTKPEREVSNTSCIQTTASSHSVAETSTNVMCCTQGKHEEEVIIAEPPTLPRHCTPLRKRVMSSSSSPLAEPLPSSSQKTPTTRPLRWGVDADKYFDRDTYCDDPNKAKIKCEQILSPVPQLTPSTPQTTRTVGIRPHRNVHLPPYFQLLLSEEDYYDFKDD